MTEEDIVLIADFMGMAHRKEYGLFTLNEYTYVRSSCLDFVSPKWDKSWDWLMPVVEKISKITFKWESKHESGVDSHYLRTFGMRDEETGRVMVRINNCGLQFGETLIEATYNAVVEFIKSQTLKTS